MRTVTLNFYICLPGKVCRDLEAIKEGGGSRWEGVDALSRQGMAVHMNMEIKGWDKGEDGRKVRIN